MSSANTIYQSELNKNKIHTKKNIRNTESKHNIIFTNKQKAQLLSKSVPNSNSTTTKAQKKKLRSTGSDVRKFITSKAKSAGRSLIKQAAKSVGGMVGSLIPIPGAGNVVMKAATMLGGSISKFFFGSGNYTIESNSLISGDKTMSPLNLGDFHKPGAGLEKTRVSRVENLGLVTIPADQSQVHRMVIDPGDASLMPQAAVIAQSWQMYQPQGLVIGFQGLVNPNNDTNLNVGRIAMCFFFDPDHPEPASYKDIADQGSEFLATSSGIYGIECAPRFNPESGLYIDHSQSGVEGYSRSTYGIVYWACEGWPTGGQFELKLAWDIAFWGEQYISQTTSNQIQVHWECVQGGTRPRASDSDWLIEPTLLPGSSGPLVIDHSVDGKEVHLFVPGLYEIEMVVWGTNVLFGGVSVGAHGSLHNYYYGGTLAQTHTVAVGSTESTITAFVLATPEAGFDGHCVINLPGLVSTGAVSTFDMTVTKCRSQLQAPEYFTLDTCFDDEVKDMRALCTNLLRHPELDSKQYLDDFVAVAVEDAKERKTTKGFADDIDRYIAGYDKTKPSYPDTVAAHNHSVTFRHNLWRQSQRILRDYYVKLEGELTLILQIMGVYIEQLDDIKSVASEGRHSSSSWVMPLSR